MDEAFHEDFSFAKYAELAWKRPLMFVQNEKGENVESHGRNLIEIGLGQLENVSVNKENELNVLRQLFTEARLKPGYVEIRSIDGLRASDRYAAAAFWTGLMYSEEARLLALDRLGTFSPKLRNEFWIAAGRDGLKASVGGIELRKTGLELLEAARRSLRRRGMDEEKYLKPIEKTLAEGKNPANRILELFQGPWKGNMAELIRYSALA